MKRKFSVGYFSSYDRGLECLLDMWPKIKEKVPEATLDIYYGWNQFDKFHAKDPQKMKWKWQMIRKMNQDGVKEHGRVNHTDLAKAMKEIQIWAYPTSFQEISCITAMKVLASGMIPVTTGKAALLETQGGFGYIVKSDDIYGNKSKQEEFVNAIIQAFHEEYNSKPQQEWVERYQWSKIAKQWDKALLDSGKGSESL